MQREHKRLAMSVVALVAAVGIYAFPTPASAFFGCTVCYSICPNGSEEGRIACEDGGCPNFQEWQCLGTSFECDDPGEEETINCYGPIDP
jgi:hypothetical protein